MRQDMHLNDGVGILRKQKHHSFAHDILKSGVGYLLLYVAAFLLVAFLTLPAQALNLQNHDQTDHQLVIYPGEGELGEDRVLISFGQRVEGICRDGCAINLSSNNARYFFGGETVVIKGGKFVIAE